MGMDGAPPRSLHWAVIRLVVRTRRLPFVYAYFVVEYGVGLASVCLEVEPVRGPTRNVRVACVTSWNVVVQVVVSCVVCASGVYVGENMSGVVVCAPAWVST